MLFRFSLSCGLCLFCFPWPLPLRPGWNNCAWICWRKERINGPDGCIARWMICLWMVKIECVYWDYVEHYNCPATVTVASWKVFLRDRRNTRWSSSVTFRGRRRTWWSSSVTFRGRCSTWWSSSVTFRGRSSTWWSSSVTFRGRCNIWWSSSVTFRGRCSTWWIFECKIGCETLYFTIENARGELEK